MLSRRQTFSMLGATCLAIAAPAAMAQETPDRAQLIAALQSVFVTRWEGTSSTPSAAIDGGEFAFAVSYRFDLANDGSVSGDYNIETNFNGHIYHGTYGIRGDVSIAGDGSISLHIRSTSFVRGDALEDGLFWQGMTGTLEFYKDSSKSGNFLFDGTLYGETDSAPFHVQISYQ